MGFDQRKFNLSAFNLPGTGNINWITAEASELIDAVTSVSKKVHLFCFPHEKITIEIRGIRYMPFTAEFHEVMGYSFALEGVFWIDCQVNEKYSCEVTPSVSKKFNLLPASENISLEAAFSHISRIAAEGAENHYCLIHSSRLFNYDAEANEFVIGVSSAITVDETACYLNLTLWPDERLIIDANNYNVYLVKKDKNTDEYRMDRVPVGITKNMIAAHSGEWLDELDRNAQLIFFTASSGVKELSASILYTERWL